MMKKRIDFRGELIKAGVKNLKEFGYGHASADNILKDDVYWPFFKSMLEECPVPAAKKLIEEVESERGNPTASVSEGE